MYGVIWCRVDPQSCDNKAISAPSWGQGIVWLAWAELGNIWPHLCLSIIGTPTRTRTWICKPSSQHCRLKSYWSFVWLVGKLGMGCILTNKFPSPLDNDLGLEEKNSVLAVFIVGIPFFLPFHKAQILNTTSLSPLASLTFKSCRFDLHPPISCWWWGEVGPVLVFSVD